MHFIKLEQTGSVIMQTFAGLALDNRSTSSPGQDTPDNPSQRDLAGIQHLLNVFFLLNICQLLALMALAHLDRRRKSATASTVDIHGSGGGTIPDEFDDGLPANGHLAEDDQEGTIRLPLSVIDVSFLPTNLPEQGHPLLASETQESYHAWVPSHPTHLPTGVPLKPNRVRRGELFAGLSASLVVFAWVLFLVTAWLRLRSKADR